MSTALVVGGSAATGRAIIEELKDRGYAITVFNRGTRNDGLSRDLEFVRGDPHFAGSVRDTLAGRSWDLAVVTYGRTRVLAEELRGRVGQLVTVSGMPVVRGHPGLPLTEDDPVVSADEAPQSLRGITPKIAATEQAVLRGSVAGHYLGTVVRYPYVYGPYSVVPMEWHVIKRCLDGRARWVLRDGGLALTGRCASVNAAALIGAVVDHPATAAGVIYHAADDRQLSEREWIEAIAALMGHEFEYVDIPPAIAPLGWSCAPLAGEDPFSLGESDISLGRIRHHLPSAEKARSELAYREKVDPATWIEKTVEFLLAHPPATDSTASSLSPLDFDYAAEDELLAWWDRILSTSPVAGRAVARGHAYEHPKLTERTEARQ